MGAALQVVVEVGRYVARRAPGGPGSGWVVGGFLAGIASFYGADRGLTAGKPARCSRGLPWAVLVVGGCQCDRLGVDAEPGGMRLSASLRT